MTYSSMLTVLAFGALSTSTVATASEATTIAAAIRFDTCKKPEWPKRSLERHETGTVGLRFLVDEQGKVVDSIIRTSSGFAALDEAARRSLASCTFTPSLHRGQPIQKWTTTQYTWIINEKSSHDVVAEADALRAAGAKGDTDALFKLSNIFNGGVRIKRDLAASATLLELAANRNHPQAALTLAQQYEYGMHGRAKDAQQAQVWYLKAAELGIAEAQYKAGAFMLRAATDGAGEAAKKGAAWLRKAADQGHTMAAYELARAHEHGKGVERDPAESLRLLRSAAGSGHTRAQQALVGALLRGAGTPADATDAVRWLEASAADRQGDAELLLAELKLEGKFTARDEARGQQLLRRAAEGGNIAAMSILGTLLQRGLFTQANAGEGAQWLTKAARYGAVEAPAGSGYFLRLMAEK